MIEKKHRSSSSSLSFFKGVKSFLSNKSKESVLQPERTLIEEEIYVKEGVAVTLTTELAKDHQGPISLLQSNTLSFLTSQSILHSSFDHKVYVHYEPKNFQVILGTNPDARHSKVFKLTVQQFAWLIQQLNEEQVVHDSLQRLLSLPDLLFQSPLLGVSATSHSRSLGKRLLRLIQRKKGTTQDIPQCLFMLPKALLMQAAGHVPLPARSMISDNTYLLFDTPYEIITTSYLNRLKRYCRYLAHCSHELVLSTHLPSIPSLHSPPASTSSKKSQMLPIQCADCPLQCGLESIQAETKNHPLSSFQPTLQFPVSYNKTQLKTSGLMMTSAVPDQKIHFDSLNKPPHAISAFQYIPPERSSDEISSLDSLDIPPEKKFGYVAVDHEAEDILVVFPGAALSQSMMNHVSFTSAPWVDLDIQEKRDKTNELKEEPWVLESALTAWHRCEIKVVTLLMRLCATVPSRYKVVIVGHSLGGAVACLCASALRNTRLLLNRPITVCTIFSPRVANKVFLQTLSTQDVNVIRITNHTGLMAHLPPRTSGLLHAGDSTVILSQQIEDAYVLENMQPELVEDTLNKAFLTQDAIETHSDSHIWGIELDNDRLKCITNLL